MWPCKEPVWSLGDPLLSLHRLQRRGLNCYMYAPKDELKHRLLWREPYTEHEAGSGSAGPHGGLQASWVPEGVAWAVSQLFPSCQDPAHCMEAPRSCQAQDSQTVPIIWNCLRDHPARGTPHVDLWQCDLWPVDPCQKSSVS